MSIFLKIISGEIPSYTIAEDERFYAFLDINPLSVGHTLVIPKQAIDYIFEIDDDNLSAMMVFSKKVAQAIKAAVPCIKVGVAIVGLEVPHAHIHLIPINQVSDMNFANPKLKLDKEIFEQTCAAIRTNFK